jgi:hypothetical protein
MNERMIAGMIGGPDLGLSTSNLVLSQTAGKEAAHA